MGKRNLKRRAGAGAVAMLCLSSGITQAQTANNSIVVESAVPGLSHADLSVKAPASVTGGGSVLTPNSSIAVPGTDTAHTHYKIFVPSQALSNRNQVSPNAMTPAVSGPPYSGYYYETPASLACIYRLVTPDANGWCDPNSVTTVPTGGSKVIAIVDAYHNSTVASDLAVFSSQFGLPAPNLQVIYMGSNGQTTTTPPPVNYGWAGEIALDVQMAHAMAPNAKIVLVEAYSNSNVNLKAAVAVAVAQVQAAGGGQVSMSYGCGESDCGTPDNSQFANIPGNVVFFASTGDNPGIEFPSSSPDVVAVGGTSTARAYAVPANRGRFRAESGWAEAGSGYSSYFTLPGYQNNVAARLGNQNKRVTPDVSAVANPTTGVWYYCTSGCGSSSTGPNGWGIVGGTSVASPLMAGMVNLAGNFRANSQAQLTWMYSKLGTSAFFDIDRSYCGPYAGYYATSPQIDSPGNPAYQFDLCTGLGSPRGLSGL